MNINPIQQYNINFDAKIRLCDKGLLDLNHNEHLLKKKSPMDFFYNVSDTKTNLDLFYREIKSWIRKAQGNPNNSEFKASFLRKCFKFVNNVSSLTNKLAMLRNIPQLYQSSKILKKASKEQPRYIDTWAILGNSTPDKFININLEDKRIEEIAKSEEASIFIMNHDNVVRDQFIYPILNSFLNYSYATLDKQKDCPRPYIVVSKNVIKNAGNNTMKKIFDKMGLVPIDASLENRNHAENIVPIRGLIDKFAEDQANIFIFPEGNNSIYKEKTLHDKFQLGFAKIIKNIFDKKNKINIIPIGITYPEDKTFMGNIYIGETIKLFKNQENCSIESNNTTQNIGNLNKRNVLKDLCNNLATHLEKSIIASKQLETEV